MRIEEYCPDQFRKLKDYWKKLDNGEDMTIFQSYEWYLWINAAYKKEKIKSIFRQWVYIVCFDENEEPILIAPIQVVKKSIYIKGIGLKKGAYFIGRKGYSDYLGFIYHSFNPVACKGIMNYLRTTYSIHHFELENVLVDTDFYCFLHAEYIINQSHQYPSAAVYLSNTIEEYTSSLKKHAKQNIRTAINRQKRDGLSFSREVIFNTNNDLQNTLLEIRKKRLGDKNKKAIKKISSKIYNWAHDCIVERFNADISVFDTGLPEWSFLVKNNDQIIGFYWGIRDIERKRYYVILAGVEMEYAWYSPSFSGLYQWICELTEKENREVEIIDFTVGNERYKTDIGGVVRNIEMLSFDI